MDDLSLDDAIRSVRRGNTAAFEVVVRRLERPLRAWLAVSMLIGPLLMAVGVGVVSGLYPARRAASLDPIEALRHE